MKKLNCVVSVSGIRGLVGENISVDEILNLASAYAKAVAKKGTVILGRDSRPTGKMFANAVAAGLQAAGCTVVDIGIVPTPTVPIMVKKLKANGGIQISASHNPVEWNALKFFNKTGRNIDNKELEKIMVAFGKTEKTQIQNVWADCGDYKTNNTAKDIHLDLVKKVVDVELIKSANLKVVIDSVNGAGSLFAPQLLQDLGCQVIPVNTREDLFFPRNPEPTAKNVVETTRIVKAVKADIGFIQDPDADRLAIIDDKGKYIGEEYTLVLCGASRLLKAKNDGVKSPIACTNLSTSRMLEDVAKKYGAKVIRSAVGEANVVDAMQKYKAVIGGEGNGGIILPAVVMGRDAQIGIALVLELMAREKKKISEIISSYPAYYIHKEKVNIDRETVSSLIPVIQKAPFAKGAKIDLTDGVKLVYKNSWLHLRASGTEPVSRIMSEACTKAEAEKLAKYIKDLI